MNTECEFPLVSVITSTWRRHDLLLGRCIPGVQAQTWPNVEHIVVSDGPDAFLPDAIHQSRRVAGHPLWYSELPVHDPHEHWGVPARLHGIEQSSGDLICYCDDDDVLRPKHCELLATALREHPEAAWASSMMDMHHPGGSITEIGAGPPSMGNIGTPMIMHRRETLEHGTWREAGICEDWEFVNQWNHAGYRHVKVEVVTCDAYPSRYRWQEKGRQ